jgi:hypothetical protein
MGTGIAHAAPAQEPSATPNQSGAPVFLAATLNGRNEVPVAGGPAVGDKDGRAVQILKIQGNQVSFSLKWKGIGAPTAGHVHLGARGVNGAVKIPFFGTALPHSVTAVVGSVTVSDAALLDSLKKDPTGFYANLHNVEFPGGAVRGQFHKVTNAVDINSVLRSGLLTGALDAKQEVPVPGGPATGDPQGRGTGRFTADGSSLNYSLDWSGIGAPAKLHLHEGARGTNGAVAAEVPMTIPLPNSITGVAGAVNGVKADLVKRIAKHPEGFYANVHTAEFPGGAIRGQLSRAKHPASANPANFNAAVVRGEQIYGCTAQPDGTYAFTQRNVSATLEGSIKHSFVKDNAGPPQWIAPDGSSVTATLISKSPNGDGNIAELDLAATAKGKPGSLFGDTVEILRLNTVGGLAPAGACDPKTKPIAKVAYQADYLFISKA